MSRGHPSVEGAFRISASSACILHHRVIGAKTCHVRPGGLRPIVPMAAMTRPSMAFRGLRRLFLCSKACSAFR